MRAITVLAGLLLAHAGMAKASAGARPAERPLANAVCGVVHSRFEAGARAVTLSASEVSPRQLLKAAQTFGRTGHEVTFTDNSGNRFEMNGAFPEALQGTVVALMSHRGLVPHDALVPAGSRHDSPKFKPQFARVVLADLESVTIHRH